MVMARTAGPFLAIVLGAAAWTAACGGEDRSDLFDGTGGADGGVPPSSGGAVAVGGTGGGGTGASGAPATGGAPAGTGGTVATTPEVIGAPCAASGDCMAGLTCLSQSGSDFVGGGPSGGICVADCSLDGQPTCTALDPTTRCVIVDDSGTVAINDDRAYCFPGCTIGDSVARKCLGRADMTCFESNAGGNLGFCQPQCNGDFECGNRVCDFALGVCVDPSSTAGLLPIGSRCDPTATERQCDGTCLQFTDTFAVCSGFCRLGVPGCGSDPRSTEPFGTFCLLSVGDPDVYSVGDSGFCMELCDCNDDCAHTDAVCDPFDADLAAAIGRAGACVPPDLAVNVAGTACGS